MLWFEGASVATWVVEVKYSLYCLVTLENGHEYESESGGDVFWCALAQQDIVINAPGY